jgi:hypothetical protein
MRRKPGTDKDSLENADRCARRKAGTATNSRLWNWLAVPGLPSTDTSPNSPAPLFIPPDEMLPHNATDTRFPAQFAGSWLSVPGFAPRDTLRTVVPPKTVKHPSFRHSAYP